ncbi:MAG: hypothetical protein P4L93_08255 [Coriobacteriia bacterium]|nr:hypothetical protein [Coriobacteriia bacterium]
MVSTTVRFEESELYGLSGQERDAAIDALSNGREFPFVIIGDTLACSGGLDVAAIAEVVKRRMPV